MLEEDYEDPMDAGRRLRVQWMLEEDYEDPMDG